MNVARRMFGEVEPVRLTRVYVWLLGAGLLLDGALLLVVDRLGLTSLPFNAGDSAHNVLHIAWGIALLVVSFLAGNGHDARAVWASLVFGAFYVALGIAGVTISNPLGLQLGPGENAFHFTVGPIALLLGAWALKTLNDAPVPSRSATPLAAVRNVPAVRRRARHRPGKARARSHRR
jgi:hypothetical protein